MLELIVFLCGAAVMVLEMVGARVLAPYLGTSIVVWTSLIGVILASLSLGYWWGGRLADRKPSFRALGLIILFAGVFIGCVAGSKAYILDFLQNYAKDVHIGSTLANLILFAPPSVLLGMVSPYAVRLKLCELDRSGRTVGNLYALSTLGSIVGTFVAGFFLIAWFGSTSILLAIAALLVVCSLLAAGADRLGKALVLLLLVLGFLVARLHADYLESFGFFDMDTSYNRVILFNSRHTKTDRLVRVMTTAPKRVQSAVFLDDPYELVLEYTRFFNLAWHFRPGIKRALVLGGGGYSFPKYALQAHPELSLDVVEIDPGITDLARRFFALADDPRLNLLHEDARTFLNRASTPYDAVFVDTFGTHYSIPFHLTTVECVRRIRDLLADDGIVIMNTICAVEGNNGRFLRAELATYKAVFPQVFVFALEGPLKGAEMQNVLLVAFKTERQPSFESADPELSAFLAKRWTKPVELDLPPLTDDYAPVDRYVTTLASVL